MAANTKKKSTSSRSTKAKTTTKKKVAKTGTIRKKAHTSSTTKKRQATRDSKNTSVAVAPRKKSTAKKTTSSRATTAKKTSKKSSMRYVNVDQSDALDAYIRQQCTSLLRRISANPKKYKLKFRVRPDAKKNNSQISSFSVKGTVTITGRKELRAKDKDADVKVAINNVIKKLETKMQRETEKRERSRKTVGKSLKPAKDFIWELSRDAK